LIHSNLNKKIAQTEEFCYGNSHLYLLFIAPKDWVEYLLTFLSPRYFGAVRLQQHYHFVLSSLKIANPLEPTAQRK
jgi:hypothetical protein